MGFFKGALIAIPIGLYFGERNLNFPLRLRIYEEQQEIDLLFDYRFAGVLVRDLKQLLGIRNQ